MSTINRDKKGLGGIIKRVETTVFNRRVEGGGLCSIPSREGK